MLPFENEIKFLQIIIWFVVWGFFGFVLKDDYEEPIALLLKFSLLLEQYLKIHFVAVVYLSLEREHISRDELCEFLLGNNVKRVFSRVLTNNLSIGQLDLRLLKYL